MSETTHEPQPIAMLDLAREVAELRPDIDAAIARILESGAFIGGPEVDAFEREAAEYLGAHHAIGVNSCTDALVLALRALGVGPGHEVITTPFTFFATAEAIVQVGATPRFADIDPVTLNLDPATVPPLINERTRALLPVHLFGLPAPMAALRDLADAHDLVILEDAAQAFGARYAAPCLHCDGACSDAHRGGLNGHAVGTLGDVAAFSFYPTKTLGAYGDAGLVTTHDPAIAARIRQLRNHGSRPDAKYVNEVTGYNSRLDAIQAAILRVKLPHLAQQTATRRAHAETFHAVLGDLEGVTLPPLHPAHVFHQFTVQLPEDRVAPARAALDAARIAHQHFYPLPLNDQPALADAGPGRHDPVPVTRAICDRVISLPIHPYLTHDDVTRVAETVAQAVLS